MKATEIKIENSEIGAKVKRKNKLLAFLSRPIPVPRFLKRAAPKAVETAALETADQTAQIVVEPASTNNITLKLNKVKSSLPWRKRRSFKIFLGSFIIVAILVSLTTYFIAIPALTVKGALDNAVSIASSLGSDLEQKDLTALEDKFNQMSAQMEVINGQIDKFEFLKSFGFTKGYYENLQIAKQISSKTQNLIKVTIPQLTPILSSAGYKVKAVDGTTLNPAETDSQIAALIAQAPELLELYEQAEPQIIDIFAEVNKVDTTYIPEIGDLDLSGKIDEVKKISVNFPEFSTEFKNIFRVLPDLLGVTKPSNFLVIFQNEKELRTSGGLVTAYGNMVIENGELSDEISAKDMWNLYHDLTDNRAMPPIRNKDGQLFLMTTNNFRCGGYETRPQDSGVYPDQNQTITTFTKYYDAAANHRNLRQNYPQYDHVVMLNTLFASDLIKYVEPIELKELDTTVTSFNMAYVLTEYFNTDAAYNKVETGTRKDLIKSLATAVKDKITALPITELPGLVKAFLNSVQARHISFYSKNSDIQAYFDEMHLSGRSPVAADFQGDYLQNLDAQYCSLKSNFFVRSQVKMDVEIAADNSITNSVEVEWINEAISVNKDRVEVIPGYIINPTGQFPYVSWSRLMVPQDSKFISSDGQSKSGIYNYRPKQYFDKDLRGQIYESVLHFRHVRKEGEDVKRKSIITRYKLPDSLKYDASKGYRLLLVKHAGKADENYLITVKQANSTTKYEIRLDRDKVLTWKNGEFSEENYDTKLDKFKEWATSLTSSLAENAENTETTAQQ
jgi:hypothetical protein